MKIRTTKINSGAVIPVTSNDISCLTYYPSLPLPTSTTTSTTYYYGEKKNMHYSGYLKDKNVYIKKVIYNNPATIVLWSDGTKTVAKCKENDAYSPECGLSICMLKKILGASAIRNIFNDWIVYGGGEVSLKDLRKKYGDNN